MPATARSASYDRNRVSVILGVTGTLELVIPLGARLGHPLWRAALKDAGVDDAVAEDVVQRISDSYVPWQENSFPGLLGNVVAGRISKQFDLGGTNCVVDAACASSFSALHLAGMELATGKSDMVVTGGIDTFNDIFMYMCFSKTPALSPTGNAKPFDAAGDGTILGEGLGIVVIKRLADAERDGDRIYAVIRGIGSSSDGKGEAIYAPSAARTEKGASRRLQPGRRHPGKHRPARGPRHRHQGRRCGRGLRPARGLRRSGHALVRPRLGQVADRPHQGRGRCSRPDQGRPGPAPQGHPADHQGIRNRWKRSAAARPPSTWPPKNAPGCPHGAARAAPRSAPSASAVPTSIWCWKSTGPTKTAADWDGNIQISPLFRGQTPLHWKAALDGSAGDISLERPAGLGRCMPRTSFDSSAPCRLALVVERDKTNLARS